MKKFTAFLAALAIGGAAASAAAVNLDALAPVKYEITPQGHATLQSINEHAKFVAQNPRMLGNGEQMMTRSWTDTRNNIEYEFYVLLTPSKVCDIVSFGEGQPQPTFDQIPYFVANIIIQGTQLKALPSTGELYPADIITYINYTACWPTYYVYDQVFTYKGELENGMIPVALRDYEPVSMTQLANDPNFTRRFQEVDYIGTILEGDGQTKWKNFTLLENALGQDPDCMIDSNACMTIVTKSGTEDNPTYYSSILDFQAFDPETFETDCKMTIVAKNKATANNIVKRLAYVGSANVEGFDPIEVTLPAFGDLHLFNLGEWSSAGFGDANPFTDAWGPYTAFYLATGDSNLIWRKLDEMGPEFDVKIFDDIEVAVEPREFNDHANNLTGYLFGDIKYAQDINLNPGGEFFRCEYPIEFIDGREVSYILNPKLNTFVPYGYNPQAAWSQYGLLAAVHNFPEMPISESILAWGTTEGFRATIKTIYKKTVNINSKADVYYHYDPNDMTKVRNFSTLGDVDFNSSVEGVVVDSAVVSAANGQITVKPAEAAPVAIYTLDGLCVLRANAAAGETVSVPAAKGIYVVTVNGKATKLAI